MSVTLATSATIEPAAIEPQPEPDRLILRSELRAMLGDVSGETLRRWARDGKLPPPDVMLSRRTQGWRLSTLRASGIGVV